MLSADTSPRFFSDNAVLLCFVSELDALLVFLPALAKEYALPAR